MTIKTFASLSLLTLMACPSAPIDSVDGLAGGSLTSGLTAPAINSTEMSTESLDATGDVTAASLTAAAVTSSGTLAGSSFVVQRDGARVGFFGLVVGSVAIPDGQTGSDSDGANPNYAIRHRACAQAFPSSDERPAAHVCTTQEAMAHALQAPDTVPTSVSGGIVHTYMSATYGLPLDNGTERIINDCGAVNDRASTASSLRLHRRDDGNWSLVVRDGCSVGETQMVCCQ